jgi:hypothetical protein
VKRDGEICAYVVFDEHQVTTDLACDAPSRLLKCSGCLAAGDVAEGTHGSNGYHDPVSIREL